MQYLAIAVLSFFISAAHADKGEVESALYNYLYLDDKGYTEGYVAGNVRALFQEADIWINSESICVPKDTTLRDTVRVAHDHIKDLRLSNDPADVEFVETVDGIANAYSLIKIALLAEWGSVVDATCHKHEQYLANQ